MGEVRSPRFRRFPFMRNGVSDHGRAVTPCITVHNILPSTFSTASASARLNFSRLNIPLHMIAVYASRPSSPAAPQHSLEGGSLLPYPHRTFTGWKAPASPGALKTVFSLSSAGYCAIHWLVVHNFSSHVFLGALVFGAMAAVVVAWLSDIVRET